MKDIDTSSRKRKARYCPLALVGGVPGSRLQTHSSPFLCNLEGIECKPGPMSKARDKIGNAKLYEGYAGYTSLRPLPREPSSPSASAFNSARAWKARREQHVRSNACPDVTCACPRSASTVPLSDFFHKPPRCQPTTRTKCILK